MPSLAISAGGRLARPSALRLAALAATLAAAPALSAVTVDFGDLSLAPSSYYNGSDGAGGFSSGGVGFNNSYTNWGGGFTSWEGFAYSNTSDTATAGFGNQYSAYSSANTGIYGVAFAGYSAPTTISFASGVAPISIDLTNTTYAYLAMLNGEGVARKFVTDDFFSVTFTSYDAGHVEIDSVTFYLAEFRNGSAYIISDWTQVDLTGLGSGVRSIELSWASSDMSGGYIDTPTYVALDNLTVAAIPEPASAAALAGAALLGFVAIRRRRSSSTASRA